MSQDIKDIKPPLDVPFGYLGWMVLALGIILAIGFFLWRRQQKNKKRISTQKTIWEIVCEQLIHLEKQDLLSKGQFKEYYSKLSDIVRHYIEERFNIRAPEMTTEEFLRSLNSSALITTPQKEILNPNFVLETKKRRISHHKSMHTKGGFNPDKRDQISGRFDQSALRADFAVAKSGLKDFLQSCDLVKFAKHVPLREEAAKALEIVRKFVEETKSFS